MFGKVGVILPRFNEQLKGWLSMKRRMKVGGGGGVLGECLWHYVPGKPISARGGEGKETTMRGLVLRKGSGEENLAGKSHQITLGPFPLSGWGKGVQKAILLNKKGRVCRRGRGPLS